MVLRDLEAPVRDGQSSGVIIAVLGAVVTFGLFPAVVWPLRFRQHVDADRVRLRGISEWLGARISHPDAPRLRLAANAIGFRPLLYLTGFVGCGLWVVLFFWCCPPHMPVLPLLTSSTYRFHPSSLADGVWISQFVDAGVQAPRSVKENVLFCGWVLVLSGASISHWIQVQLHARSIRRFLDEFNKISLYDALSPVFLAPVGSGLRPLWSIGAVIMALLNAPWGIPLMLAGSVQRRYTKRIGPAMRGALAARLREIIVQRRALSPPIAVAAAHNAPNRCMTVGCRFPLPAGARFCPRCGKRAASRIDRVA